MDMLIKQLLNKDKNNLYIIGNNRIGSLLLLAKAKQGLLVSDHGWQHSQGASGNRSDAGENLRDS